MVALSSATRTCNPTGDAGSVCCGATVARTGTAAASGRRMSNRKSLPIPGSLSTAIEPPISVTSRRQIAKPSPLPPKRREIDPSTWVKSSNILEIASGAIPMPVSTTLNSSLARPPSAEPAPGADPPGPGR